MDSHRLPAAGETPALPAMGNTDAGFAAPRSARASNAPGGTPPPAGTHLGTPLRMDTDRLDVAALMRTELVTLDPDERLDVASDIMTLGRIRHMPVVRDGEVVGILTQRDLYRAAISSVLELRPAAEREWLAKIHVAEVMTQPVTTVEPELPMGDAVRLMLDRRIGCLPVIRGGRLVGMVSESDCLLLLRGLLAGLSPGGDS